MRILAVMLAGTLLLASACSSDERSQKGSAANSSPEPSAPAAPEPSPPAAPEPSLPAAPAPGPSVTAPTAADCSQDAAALEGYAWGDFVVLPDDEREKAACISFRPPDVDDGYLGHGEEVAYPDPGEKEFTSLEDATTGLPAGTFIPALPTIPEGYRFVAVIAYVNPETDEVTGVQTVYVLASRDPASLDPRPLFILPDLWVVWQRQSAFPIVQIDDPPVQPVEKIYVTNHKGLYLPFPLFSEREREARGRVLDAIQWTTEDGAFWTVQGVLPFPEFLSLAEQIALGYAAVSAP